MSCATSYDSVMERHTFPNVVGCEEFRAKAMIRYWLKVKTGLESVTFRMFNHLDKNKLTRPSKDGFGNFGMPAVSQHSNEIILWYDYKFDAVAITPYWFGSVHYEKERSETGSVQEDSVSDIYYIDNTQAKSKNRSRVTFTFSHH